VARLTFKSDLVTANEPANLSIVGSAKIGESEIAHQAVPAEDRMQAFLWRHLVPAQELKILVFDPTYEPPPKRIAPIRPLSAVRTNDVVTAKTTVTTNTAVAAKSKFSKQQITGRLRQLKLLFEEGLLTDGFYCEKVAECETGP
jgi:hypothetical protein